MMTRITSREKNLSLLRWSVCKTFKHFQGEVMDSVYIPVTTEMKGYWFKFFKKNPAQAR